MLQKNQKISIFKSTFSPINDTFRTGHKIMYRLGLKGQFANN